MVDHNRDAWWMQLAGLHDVVIVAVMQSMMRHDERVAQHTIAFLRMGASDSKRLERHAPWFQINQGQR